MNSRLIFGFLLSSIASILPAQTEPHNFSVKDDIAMVRFSDPSGEVGDFHANDIKYSPDGNLVAVVTTRGLLDTDQVESTISLFDLVVVQSFLHHAEAQAPRPKVLAVISVRPHEEQTSDYAPVIRDLRWGPDSKRLYFVAETAQGAMQLDVAEIDGKSGFHSLTPSNEIVSRFDVSGDEVVYTSTPLGHDRPLQGDPINRDSLSVTGHRLTDILFPGQMTSYYAETFTMEAIHMGTSSSRPRPIPGYVVRDHPANLFMYPFKVSPDGHHLLTIAPVLNLPESWKEYEPAPAFTHRRLDGHDPQLTAPENALRPRQYALVDLLNGKMTTLVNAPNANILGYFADDNTGAWSSDGKRLLVTNVFLPPDAKDDRVASIFLLPCAVASIDLPSLSVRCLFFRDRDPSTIGVGVSAVRFGQTRDIVQVSVGSGSAPVTTTTYAWKEGSWTVVTSPEVVSKQQTLQHRPIDLSIKQSLNDPPMLWATELGTGTTRRLWDPNPQLSGLSFGEASVLHWKDDRGTEWTGGVVKPVGYVQGRRYPLVVQMYQFREHEFLTDGTDPTAFAARELASAGFVVLQIRKKPSVLSEVDPQTALEGYRSGIQSLSDAGLIDPSKVGVVGFSWTCWYAVNAIIKAPRMFAAATIADGLDSSYMQYLLFGPGPPNTHEQMDRIRGGSPFGAGLQRWVAEAPGFHLDQVQTPVRIEAMKPGSVLQEWELYSSLYMQHKPVDMIYFPEGTHIHQRPQERFESQQGNIDWMRFWLQGYEDPDPLKRSQYERWRAMEAGSRSFARSKP